MLLRIGIAMLLLSFMMGCSSSQPAPKPLSAVPQISPEQMERNIREAEAKQPCSTQNLKNASDAQKRACDPTIGMFDNIKPAQPPATGSPNAQNRQNEKQATN